MPSGIDPQSQYLVKLDSVSKNFTYKPGLNLNVLQDISFTIKHSERGSISTILAPFGSGKSTLLKIISGLMEPSEGKIFFNKELPGITPYIPEKPSSFPWMNVKENIRFSLKLNSRQDADFQKLISMVGLTGYEDHYPDNKSTGFRFRISLARALAVNPQLIVIDDSFKMIKKESRDGIYSLIRYLAYQQNFNFVLGTTNLIEAIQLSDCIFLMSKRPGKIIKELAIEDKHKQYVNDHKSEIFTTLKTQIETAFEASETVTTINYSV